LWEANTFAARIVSRVCLAIAVIALKPTMNAATKKLQP
jgi:hypothetical protein